MFAIGSSVVYKSEGVCVISDIRAECFGAPAGEQYYVLTPVRDSRSVLFVPVNNEALTAFMRELMSADEINKMVDELRGQRLELPPECRVRNNLFKDIISRGDRRELVVLVLTLSEKIEQTVAAGKKVGTTEMSAISRAERMLYEEFCATTDISSISQVVPFLRGELRLGSKE